MAWVFIVTPSGGLLSVIYSVGQSVGLGGANVRDDVLLVQFFLSVLRQQDARGNSGFLPPGDPPLIIDGAFGQKTANAIRFFQEESNRRAGRIKADQRIDPLKGGLLGSLTGSLLSMALLNFEYLNRQGKGFHSNISFDPLFPSGLRKVLFMG